VSGLWLEIRSQRNHRNFNTVNSIGHFPMHG
jgi:hypothetical protein